jgi:hypothetical protein
MTRLIVCCDGTWNTPDQRENGIPSPTNVVKFYNALAAEDRDGEAQLVYYHPGVGTDGDWWDRLAGGGLGEGLDHNVKSAYRWLAAHYAPGDRIHLLGFSRGAYTARSVGGMIARCGLIDLRPRPGLTDADGWAAVDKALAMYRRPPETPGAAPEPGEKREARIHFIGVWDTVGSLGIPDEFAFLNLIDDPAKHSFHDTALSALVDHARHAVAMDERRHSFSPTLWTNPGEWKDTKQVWFPGVHGDVGGGYANSDLADGALDWMMEEAEVLGLGFRPGVRARVRPDPLGVMHDSLTGIFRRLKKRPRPVPRVHEAGVPVDLHESAFKRHSGASLHHAGYWTSRALDAGRAVSCEVFAREPWNYTGLYLEAGVAYELTAEGEWLDRSIKCGPGGTDDGDFQIAELAHVGASLIDRAEALFRRLSDNDKAELWWSRRDGNAPWFRLMGVVANCERGDCEHEMFAIGEGVRYTPKRSGYLYCFANDAWEAYGNNRGAVRLSVQVAAAAPGAAAPLMAEADT